MTRTARFSEGCPDPAGPAHWGAGQPEGRWDCLRPHSTSKGLVVTFFV